MDDAINGNGINNLGPILYPFECKSLEEEVQMFQIANFTFGKLDVFLLTSVGLTALHNCEGVCDRYVVKVVEEGC